MQSTTTFKKSKLRTDLDDRVESELQALRSLTLAQPDPAQAYLAGALHQLSLKTARECLEIHHAAAKMRADQRSEHVG